MLVHTGLLSFVKKVKLFILVLSLFLKTLNYWNKNIKANIFGVQANNSIMCGYFCIGFIDFIIAGKKLTDFTGMFSPRDFEKNDCIIFSYFEDEWN